MFSAGEASVTHDLLPLAFAVARERRLDDELFVTAWLWEEGKHADFLRRYLAEVAALEPDDQPPLSPPARKLLEEELPAAMSRLYVDCGSVAEARAITTYCLIVEGVLFDAGRRVVDEALEPRDLLPGLTDGLRLVNRDESRHVAYGLHALGRLANADAAAGEAAADRAKELAPTTKALADSVMLGYDTRPFELPYVLQEPFDRLMGHLRRVHEADRA
jgi:ribonucleoside-diphosphate reductase beta chain